jgi:hypothetical protein
MHPEVKVAVIIVFTKYDLLFNEYHRKAAKVARSLGKPNAHTTRTDVETNAKHHLDDLIHKFQQRFEYVAVSTHERYPGLTYTSYRHPTRLTRPVF